tara:strand:- start:15445 stop:16269 length:825 start_codon:yes stop_codon:yes gene_type:complete
MTQQVKRAPGRPKAVAPAPVADAPVSKRPAIRRKEVADENKEYEIPKGHGIVFMLPQKGITVYDKENDTVREIRYCPNEPSIWSDEQGDKATRQSVAFREGKLFVPRDKPNLRKFMELHPQNMSNGGKLFREVNKKKDAEQELQKEFLTTDAISLVRDSDIQTLLPIAMYFNVGINTPVSEIRFNLLRIAKSKPQEFIESFDSPQVKARSIIQQAADYQILNLKVNGAYWFDSNSLIVSVPVGQDSTDVMVRFCLTEKGASVLSDLEEKLIKLA